MPDGYITAEGASVQEAVLKALSALKISREQADIKVISEGKQGFLGIGSKPAVVKVGIKEEAVAEMELHDILADLDIKDEAVEENYRPKFIDKSFGTIEVVNGVVNINNPTGEGKYATVKPGNHIILRVNGKKVDEETYVSEEDTVEAELVNDEPVSNYVLTLSDDKVEAHVRLIRRPGARYKLKDQEKANGLMLLTMVEELIEPSPATVDQLKEFLAENNIVRGVFEDALAKVVDNPNSTESFLVAQGQAPVECVDAHIKLPFQENDSQGEEEEELFGRVRLISLLKGDIVAVKIPAEEGVDGWTVTGETIAAKQAVDCDLRVKKGCEISEDGLKVIATVAGRPVIEPSGNTVSISVEPVYEVKNVDSTTGDIKFSGDVEVKGDVKEGYAIEAEGNVEVFGDVTRATIKAGASVKVHKMILGSTVVAGGLGALYTNILPTLKEIKELVDKTFVIAKQLKDAPGFKTSDLQAKGDGQLIQLLMDSKFHTLPRLINDLSIKVLNSDQPVNEEVVNVTNLLHKSLCGLGPLHLEKLEHLQILSKATDQICSLIGAYMTKVDSITARYVQNSTLFSSGDIIIDGQGCYISSVNSGGEVVVTGSPGIARGVKIVAQHNVIIKELGSEFDTQTSVTIKGNGKISAELVHPNVILQIGNEKFRVDNSYKNFDAYVNHEGRLMIDKLLGDEKRNNR